MAKATTDAAQAAVTQAETGSEGETPRPTGKNAEQDEQIAALTATHEALVAQMAAMQEQMAGITAALAKSAKAPQTSAPVAAPAIGAIPNEEASKAVLAARSKEAKTYRALQEGTDINQGVIPAGALFSTTQPQGSWMELVED